MKSINDQLRKDIHSKKSPEEDYKALSSAIGFVASCAVESIQKDIEELIKNDKFDQLDGYIYALSKIMKHDLAMKCISLAFSKNSMPVPKKYNSWFSKNANSI